MLVGQGRSGAFLRRAGITVSTRPSLTPPCRQPRSGPSLTWSSTWAGPSTVSRRSMSRPARATCAWGYSCWARCVPIYRVQVHRLIAGADPGNRRDMPPAQRQAQHLLGHGRCEPLGSQHRPHLRDVGGIRAFLPALTFGLVVARSSASSDRSCWANRRAYSAAAGGTLMSSKEIPSMSVSTTALRFELVLATISRCTAWSWRNSGMMLMNIAVIEPGQQAMVERLRRL